MKIAIVRGKLFIIILDFKGGQELLDCLESVRRAKTPAGWEKQVLVIDNNRRNLGFARGCNLGIKKALKQKATAVLLLNQDTIADKEFLGPLLKNPGDIVAPVIKFKRQGKWVDDFGGRVNWWIGRSSHRESPSGHSRCVAPRWGNPDYVSGCCMLIKKSVFEKIGLLDERYFLYFEDVDFCLRAKKAGFKIAIEPKSFIIHKLRKTREKSLKQKWHLLKSNLIFVNRYVPFWRRPIAYFYWFLISVKILL